MPGHIFLNFYRNFATQHFFIMNKTFKTLFLASVLCLVFLYQNAYAQELSSSQKKTIIGNFDKQIKTISSISAQNIDMLPVYSYQVAKAEDFLKYNEKYVADQEIYSKFLELKTVVSHGKDLVEFLTPRASELYYLKAINLLTNDKKTEAYNYLTKAVNAKEDNVMANYELCKISLDSNQIISTTERLTKILSKMSPTQEEKLLCQNMIAYAYDKNLLQSMVLIKEGKFAYAYDILQELEAFCKKDAFGICHSEVVKKNMDICKKGIYDNHIDITKRAIKIGDMKVAGDFVQNTYDYFQRNREVINQSDSFDEIVHKVVNSYLAQAQTMKQASMSEARADLLAKAKELSAMVSGDFEASVLKQIAAIQGTTQTNDTKLDSIENLAQNQGYCIDYPEYTKDSIDAQAQVAQIEKAYIPSSDNKLPKESVAVASTKTKTIDKAIDDKFYETRTFMQVNNYEKALEVLEKANRLAKIEGDKKAVESMYKRAIREITAKRMSMAEYAIFEGNISKADSLVALTNDLIGEYNMKQDTAIVRIMNSYLRVIDDKVCSKKQDEINVLVYDILECIRKNDFLTAEIFINKAMQIKGNNDCRLDKQRVRSLKRQIEEPLKYIEMKQVCEEYLNNKDTNRYLLEYAKLEYFYNIKKLGEMSVQHTSLRDVLTQTNDDNLAIATVENLIKYQQYEGAIEAVGALKNMGYKAKHTKKIQKRIGKIMAQKEGKRQDKIAESYRMEDKYNNDKWFKYFLKEYKKNFIKFQKMQF